MNSYARLSEEQSQLHTISHPRMSVQLEELNTGDEGLTQDEANRRLLRDGPNSIAQTSRNTVERFVAYYLRPAACMIWVVILIEILRKAWLNLGLLIFLQFINGFIAWRQDRTTEKTIERLKKTVSPTAYVKRDCVYSNIDASKLVIGDRIFLKAGDIVPADAILGPGYVEVDQSELTGETLSVVKYEGEEVYQGSIIKKGESEAIVRAIGSGTFYNRTHVHTETAIQGSELQRILYNVGMVCMCISIAVGIVVMIVVITKEDNLLETISICAVMIIAATPVAMEMVCRTHLAVGAGILAKNNAVTTKLQTIEALSSLNIICCDKTGMLTKNEPVAKPPKLIEFWDVKDIYLFASLCSKPGETADAIDRCILNAAQTLSISLDNYTVEDFVPFDSRFKRTEATVKNLTNGDVFKVSKGAPQVILAMCPRDESLYEQVSAWVQDLAQAGYKSLGVARTDKNGKWTFVGCIPMYDPIRDDAIDTLKQARAMGIGIKMITGDQIDISKEVARQLGIGIRVFNSEMLSEETGTVNKEIIDNLIVEANGFGEVFPEHKFAIVKILQDRGYIVGITGRVASDETALKKADIGIAVFNSSDACKAVADLILTQPDCSILITSILSSRKVIQRILNYVTYRLSCTFSLLLFLFISMISITPSSYTCTSCSDLPNAFSLPVISLILLILLNDGATIALAYDNISAPSRPERWRMRKIYERSLILGSAHFLSSILLLLVCISHMNSDSPNSLLHLFRIPILTYGEVLTIMYMKISLSDSFTLFSARTSSWFWKHKPSAALLISAVIAMIGATVISMTWFIKIDMESDIPDMKRLDWKIGLFVWIYCIVFFIIQDSCKVLSIKLFLSSHSAARNTQISYSDSLLQIPTGQTVGSIITRRSMQAVREDIIQ